MDLSKADLALPTDMRRLLEQHDSLRASLARIAAGKAATLDLARLKTLPPVMPQNILNAAVNYTEHAQEMSKVSTSTATPNAPPPPGGIPGFGRASRATHDITPMSSRRWWAP